jgi:hypothetical protein
MTTKSYGFLDSHQGTHRTGATTDDHERLRGEWWTVHALLRLLGVDE